MRILALVALVLGAAGTTPVVKYKDDKFGAILATPKQQALYYWTVEKRAGGKIRCTGSCARLWPPLVVKSRTAVPKHVRGINGTFGVVRRPNGALQVTFNGSPSTRTCTRARGRCSVTT